MKNLENENMLINANEEKSSTATCVKKKRKDVFVLCMIVFIVAAILVGLTIAKMNKNAILSDMAGVVGMNTAVSDADATADSVGDASGTCNFEITGSVADGVVTYDNAGYEISPDDPDFDVVDLYENEDGDLVVFNSKGGYTIKPKGTFYVTNFDLDEAYGTVPVSADDLVNRAYQQSRVAHAASISNSGYISQGASAGSGNFSIRNTGNKATTNGKSTSGTSGYVQISGTWLQIVKSKCKFSCSWSGWANANGTYRAGFSTASGSITGTQYSSSQTKKDYTGSTQYFVFVVSAWGTAGSGKNDTFTSSCSMSNCNLTLWNYSTDTPSAKSTCTGISSTWRTNLTSSAYVTLSGSARLTTIYSVTPNYYTSGGTKKNSVTYSSSTKITDAGSRISFITTTKAAVSSATGVVGADTLYVDNDAPKITSLYVTNSSFNQITAPVNSSAGQLYLCVTMNDNGGYGCASGIYSINAYNDRSAYAGQYTSGSTTVYVKKSDKKTNLTTYPASNGLTYTTNASGAKNTNNKRSDCGYTVNSTIGTKLTGTSFTIYIPIKNQDSCRVNGTWTVKVADFVGKEASKTCNFTYYDTSTPTISSVSIAANDTKATIGSENWTNTATTLKFSTNDYSQNTDRDCAKINTVTVSYTLYGESAAKTLTWTAAGTNSSSVTGTPTMSVTGNYVYTKDFSYACLRYDYTTIKSLTITVSDAASNTKTVSYITSGSGQNGISITGRLDTVAPGVLTMTLESSNGTISGAQYYSKDVRFKVKIQDAKSTTLGYYGKTSSGARFNNGTGLKTLRFYADEACTKALNVYSVTHNSYGNTFSFNSSTYQGSSATVVTQGQEFYFDIRSDTANTEFGGAVYVTAEDWMGNISSGQHTMTADTGTTYAYGWTQINTSNCKSKGVYIWNTGVKGLTGIKRDTFKPQIVVKDSTGVVIASTMSATDTKNLGPTGAAANNTNSTAIATTTVYTYPWLKTANRSITIEYYYGCSGGALSGKKNGSADSSFTQSAAAYGSGEVGANNTATTNVGNLGTSLTQYTVSGISNTQTRSVSTSGNTTYSTVRKATKTVPLSTQGETTYEIKFTSNAQNVTSDTITIVTRLDSVAPTVKLLGFSTNAITSTSQISSLTAESTLLNSNSWVGASLLSGNQGLYAVFELADVSSKFITSSFNSVKYGIGSSPSQTQSTTAYAKTYSDMDGTSVTGTSSNCYYMEFRYDNSTDPTVKGNIFKYSIQGITSVISSRYFVQIQMFNRNKLESLKDTTNTLTMKDNLGSSRTVGTYLRYKLGVTDFVGNVAYAVVNNGTTSSVPNAAYVSSKKEWNANVLRYYVDPFTVNITTVNMYQANSNSWNSTEGIKNAASYLANNAKAYTSSAKRTEGWAKYAVIVTFDIVTGISPFEIDYKYRSMSGKYDAITNKSIYGAEMGYANSEMATGTATETYLGKTVWITFENSETKDIKLAFKISSKASSTGATKDGGGDLFYIRQDVSKPKIESVFLSYSTTYTNAVNNKLLTFNALTADPQTGSYIFVLDTSAANSPAYNSTINYIYTTGKVSVYVKVTDKPGALEGSGVKSVTFGSENLVQDGQSGTSYFYRSASASYGYNKTGTTGLSVYTITVKDNQDNYCSATYGHSAYLPSQISNTATATVKSGATASYRVLPVVDDILPYINLVKPTDGTAGYYTAATDTATDEVGTHPTVYKFKSSESTIIGQYMYPQIQFKVGISGITLYVRTKAYDTVNTNRLTGFTYFSSGYKGGLSMPANYDYEADGWGYYSGADWVEYSSINLADDSYPYKARYESNVNASGKQSGTMSVKFELTSLKKGIEILAVSGTGRYCIIDLGNLFIDTEAPVISDGMTFFTVNANEGTTVNYNTVQKIWTEKPGYEYTNGTVDTYYYVVDTASGVDNVKYGGGTLLTKVTVNNVPVWTIGGKVTNVRVVNGATTATVTNVGGWTYINGYQALDTGNDMNKIAYKSTNALGKTTKNLTMYRLTLSSGINGVVVVASDKVPKTRNSTAYNILIDKANITSAITASVVSTTAAIGSAPDYNGSKFTNKNVYMAWKMTFGTSGFEKFTYTVKNNLTGVTGSSITIGLPQFTKSSAGKIVMTYYKSSGERTQKTLASNWTDGFEVKVSQNNWFVGGVNTAEAVNTSKYGAITNLSTVTWKVYTNMLYCFITEGNNANKSLTYTVTGYNTITDEYSVGKARPTTSQAFNVKIDIVKPTIHTDTGNYSELAATDKWHALEKSLRIQLTDDLSGIDKTGYVLANDDGTDSGNRIDNCKITYTIDGTNYTKYMVLDSDGLYRAYNTVNNPSTGTYSKNGLFYFDKYINYTLTITDEAGNSSAVVFKPMIDKTPAEVTAVNLYVMSGSMPNPATDLMYSQDTSKSYTNSSNYNASYQPITSWIYETMTTNVTNWAPNYVYAVIDVSYGNSGFKLQYCRATTTASSSDLYNKTKWTDVSSSEYTVYKAETVDANGIRKTTLIYKFAASDLSHYMYYRFRAVSNAQRTELSYKSFSNSSLARATESDDSRKLSIELESYEKADKKYAGMNGYASVSLSNYIYTGLIAFDTAAPIASSMTLYKQDPSTLQYSIYKSTSSSYIKVDDNDWFIGNALMELTFTSNTTLASGNVIYVQSSSDGVNWTNVLLYNPATKRVYTKTAGKWAQGSTASYISTTTTTRKASDNATTMSYATTKLSYTIDTSTNNVMYRFWTETGAGRRTATNLEFGTYDSTNRHVYGIKIDMNNGQVTASAKATFTTYDGALGDLAIQTQLANEYDNGTGVVSYDTKEQTTYTNRNTVIVRLTIQQVGYSGMKVVLEERTGTGVTTKILDTITYAQFNAEGGSAVKRYYRIAKNGETQQTVYLQSIAGRKSTEVKVYARIDNTTPILYINDISGTKANNWGWTTNNLYNKTTPEYWYTSGVTFSFSIGVIEKINGTEQYQSHDPYSGYTTYYSSDNGNTWNGITFIDGKFTIGESKIGSDSGTEAATIINGKNYMFKIESNAGKNADNGTPGTTYILGNTIFNNQGKVTYNKGLLSGQILAKDGNDDVTGHIIKNGTGDYDDGSYKFIFYIDSNDYFCNYDGKVFLGKNNDTDEYDIRTDVFMSYSSRIANSANVFSSIAGSLATYKFKRGDVLELTYTANTTGAGTEAYHKYFQSYTESIAYQTIAGTDGQETINPRRTLTHTVASDNVAYETTGTFKVQFEGYKIDVTSYFIAEVDVSYGQDVYYLQQSEEEKLKSLGMYSDEYATTGKAVYTYKDGNTVKTKDVSLSYVYYHYFPVNGSAVAVVDAGGNAAKPTEIGPYYVNTSVTSNTGSFRVGAGTSRKDFVLKYFVPVRTGDDFNVNNATDFEYVERSYYNIGADRNLDLTERTYLSATYRLNADIAVSEGLKGAFSGDFNGQDHNVQLAGGTVKGNYALFETISGKVYKLNVTLNKDITVDADNWVEVALLAGHISNGTVYGISVVGDIEIKKAPSGSIIGGLVAGANKANIGNTYGGVFTDIRITNNGNALKDVYVSSVVGHMSDTTFMGTYAFGEIELYNVTNVAAGILYGYAEVGTSNSSSVYYLNKNVFVNGNTVYGISNHTTGITVKGLVAYKYDDFVGLDTMLGGVNIAKEIVGRLYRDFGYQYTDAMTCGNGSKVSPLIIKGNGTKSVYEQILAINGYMNSNFLFAKEVKTVDMSSYDCTIAVTKVFQGYLGTETNEYVKFNNFAGNVETYDKEYFGLFGQLDGAVKNLVFNDIKLDFEYTGEKDLYAGIVAAKAYENANINNIILIGTEKVKANGTAYVGGIVAYAGKATIKNIFNVNNISARAERAIVGGIAAYAKGTDSVAGITLPDGTDGSIFLLGRVEVNGGRLVAGAALGRVEGSVNGGSGVYAIAKNLYINGAVFNVAPVGDPGTETYNINTVSFSSDDMRRASLIVTDIENNRAKTVTAFEYVFGNNNMYPIAGSGSSKDPFIIETETDFSYIDLALYASYSVIADIEFHNFKTIGEGLAFSGELKGNTGDDISAELGRIISLSNVTGPLVYNNTGIINDLSISVEYTAEVKAGEVFRYGAVAIYNSGEIKSVTISGNVSITSATRDNTIYVSGFVAESRGGVIDTDSSKLQNSISALTITITGGGTLYVGGYAAIVTGGTPMFSYGIATGTITVNGAAVTHAGLLVGMVNGDCVWELGEAATIDYTYDILIDGNAIQKYDEDENPIESNFTGLIFEKK